MAEEFLGENFSRLKSGQWKIPLYIFDTVFKYRKASGMLFFSLSSQVAFLPVLVCFEVLFSL